MRLDGLADLLVEGLFEVLRILLTDVKISVVQDDADDDTGAVDGELEVGAADEFSLGHLATPLVRKWFSL